MLALNEVHEGDCLELMSLIPDGSIDMVLADLPYGTTACKWDTVIPLEPLWEQYKRIIKPNGAIVLTASQPFTSVLIMSNLTQFKYAWVWQKTRPTGFLNAKKRPLKTTEDVCIFGGSIYNPQGLMPIQQTSKNRTFHRIRQHNHSQRDGGSFSKTHHTQEWTNYPSNVLNFAGESRHHPTQKPVALFEYLIKTYTNEGQAVLDNTAGSCTTAVAAIRTRRNFICIEKNRDKDGNRLPYVDIGRERIRVELEQPTLFEAAD